MSVFSSEFDSNKMSWFDNGEQSAALRYLNDFSAGGGGGGLTFDPANPVFHGTGTTNAILNSTCVGPSAQVATGGDAAFGFAANVANGGLALGQGANSVGNSAIAMQIAQAQGDHSFAWGLGTIANGEQSQACGQGAQTSEFGQLCFGRNATGVSGSVGCIAFGDAAIVGSNSGASMAFGSSTQVGDDNGLSCLFGAGNITQATASDNVVCGMGNNVNSGCSLTRIFGSQNTVGSGSSNNIVIGNQNAIADSSARNVIIADSFSTSGIAVGATTVIGNNAITDQNECVLVGFNTVSTIHNGLALGANARANPYVVAENSPLAIGVEAGCMPAIADVFAPTNYLVININGVNWRMQIQQE